VYPQHRATCAAPLALVHLPFAQATRLHLKWSCASSPVTATVAELRKQPGDGIDPVTSTQIAYTPISTTSSWLIRSMFRRGLSRVIQTPGDLRRTAFIAKHRGTCAAPLALDFV